jgi:hypothetical protein
LLDAGAAKMRGGRCGGPCLLAQRRNRSDASVRLAERLKNGVRASSQELRLVRVRQQVGQCLTQRYRRFPLGRLPEKARIGD